MYNDHATTIQRECRDSVVAFQDTLAFVLATIQEPLERIPGQMADIRELGENAPALWGMKRKGYQNIQEHGARLHAHLYAQALLRPPLWRERALITLVSTIHGLNLAKAGFALQLTVGEVGCLDEHNRRRFGLSRLRIRPERMTPATLLKHATTYVDSCDALGGCAHLWDSWCDYVAAQRPDSFPDGNAVSAAHLCAVQSRTKGANTMDSYLAVGIAEGFEEAESEEQIVEAWQYLHDTGLAYKLQGWFGRAAQDLISQGVINS